LTGPERGFLLLTSHLGNPERPVLTTAQFRVLSDRMKTVVPTREDREMTVSDLLSLGYGKEMAFRILGLLSEEEVLHRYLSRGHRLDCVPVTRITEGYPPILRQRLGLDSPGTLWAKGDLSILNTPAIALVGSRELKPENHAFAEAVGRHAAKEGLTLVSGNARGADRAAQESCLSSGGKVISIVADELWKHHSRENVLYLSEEDYDSPFSAQRALSRNRCIHALGRLVFVAQSNLQKGGTWDGTAKNLQFGWSPVVCYRDGSRASRELEQMGAYLISLEELEDFRVFPEQTAFF
jgi:predicted Rossmann fold nucleotide-binding protein DprA/Smf involved in DNA uptake